MSNNQLSQETKNHSSNGAIWLGFIVLVAVLILAVGVYFAREIILASDFASHEREQYNAYGPIGDFFGGFLNPIFSFLALMALIFTLWQQNKIIEQQNTVIAQQDRSINVQLEELEATREELKLTREEAEKTSAALEAQHKSMEVQSFENKFFELLSRFSDLLNTMETPRTNGINTRGKAYIRETFDSFRNSSQWNSDDRLSEIIEHYDACFRNRREHLSAYFRFLNRIIDFVDAAADVNDHEKRQYIKIIRSTLSDFELVLLFYGSFSSKAEDFPVVLRQYNFFDNLPHDLLLAPDDVVLFNNHVDRIETAQNVT